MTIQEAPFTPQAHPKVPRDLKPGHVFVTLEEEFENFDAETARFRADPSLEGDFVPYRLRMGTYGQRQMDQQMMRIKLPYGGVNAEQMEALGEVAEKHSGMRRGHITTRENFQFHFVPLEQASTVMRILGEVGLSTREACGHTVRNVTSCPYAGVSGHELFDTTPYAAAYARQMIRNPICQNLPRKWKTSFSCGPIDCAGSPFHDMGFVADIREQNGEQMRGFKIVVGGGTSTMVQAAETLWEFARADDGQYIRVAEAALKVFDKEGGEANLLRKNMNKARVKFLVKKLGIEEFRRQVEEELAQPWAWEPVDMEALKQLAPEGPTPGEAPNSVRPGPEFTRWVQTNAIKQRQPGFFAVTITVPLGNITPEQFRALAAIMRRFAGGNARTQQNQNLVLRWVHEASLPALHAELTKIGFGDPDAGLLADVVACPGTDSCKMGITSSQGVGVAIREEVLKGAWGYENDPLVQAIHVKASGCPNGCGQHHLAAIGLQGSSFSANGATIPCFDIFLGGGNYVGGGKFATRVARVPSKRTPAAIKKMIDHYVANRNEGEDFVAFVDRHGPKAFDTLFDDFKEVGPIHQEIDTYMDWGKEELFEVIRGEGECAV
ncbi:MAG TPA: nitrite/sulfite reductase [Dehalococcoidia bacterium]|nr:nitrite/sulfite reductase [Dehalococcoidia bacterium]